MLDHLIDAPDGDAAEIVALTEDVLDGWLAGQPPETAAWIRATRFAAKPDTQCLVAAPDGRLGRVVVGVAAERDPWAFAGLPAALP